MKGTINRVVLKDFITYSSAEFVPEKHLNVIIGPNGTGKSTLICAIILGLGGKPKLTGRAHSVESYIKTGCKSARIDIELHNPDGVNKITRVINKDGKSIWYLNDRQATQKQVEQLVSSLNIQVDNLCQFLPQDRVAEFAKMSPQQVLENTEKCIGSPEVFENHTKLKDLTKTEKALTQEIESVSKTLKAEEQQNSRIAVAVENMSERENLLDEIDKMKKKQAWLYYEERRNQIDQMKADKKNAEKRSNEHKTRFAPIHKAIEKLKEEGRNIEQSRNARDEEIGGRDTEITRTLKLLEGLKEKIAQTEHEYKGSIESDKRRQAKLQNIEQQISKLENDLRSCTTAEGSTKAALEEVKEMIDIEMEQLNALSHEEQGYKSQHDNISEQLRAHEQDRHRLQDVGRHRMELLRRYKDVYEAVKWLRENKDLFKGRVYEPIMLEINIPNLQNAKYVESLIARRDLLAFTCEEKEDMNTLLRQLRDSRKLLISAVHSGSEHPPSSAYKPNVSMDELRKFGFHTFLIDMITSPEAIKKYLCRTYRIYTVPVGDRNVFIQNQNVPSSISVFFSDIHRFDVRFSKYTGEKATNNRELPSAHFLGFNTDTKLLQQIEQNIEKLHTQEKKISFFLANKRHAREQHSEELRILQEKKKRLEYSQSAQSSIQAKLNSMQREKRTLESERIDPNEEKRKCKKINQRTVSKLCNANLELQESIKKLQECVIESQLKEVELADIKNKITKKEAISEQMNQKYEDAERLLQQIKQRIEEQRTEVKRLYANAKAMSDGIGPDHPKYKQYVKCFNSLPSTIEELDRAIQSKQGKADCLDEGNAAVRQEYESRLRTIAELKHKIESTEGRLELLRKEKEEIKKKWLPRLTTLIGKINEKFGQYFSVIQCAGEVSLSSGNNKEDYEDYGIEIRVQYRKGEAMQLLTHQTQSGGERATGTAIYLIALQGLTHIPFCCVDEINQGMDAVNERHIFNLLVQTTSQANSAQYFLLTPKLLPRLTYSPNVAVHTILNGGLVTPKCNINKIIAGKKKHMETNH